MTMFTFERFGLGIALRKTTISDGAGLIPTVQACRFPLRHNFERLVRVAADGAATYGTGAHSNRRPLKQAPIQTGAHSNSSQLSQPRRHRGRHVLQRLAQIAGLLAMNQPHVK
jgi:hypothetical protein